jgi:hypothetical protein
MRRGCIEVTTFTIQVKPCGHRTWHRQTYHLHALSPQTYLPLNLLPQTYLRLNLHPQTYLRLNLHPQTYLRLNLLPQTYLRLNLHPQTYPHLNLHLHLRLQNLRLRTTRLLTPNVKILHLTKLRLAYDRN